MSMKNPKCSIPRRIMYIFIFKKICERETIFSF